MKIYVSDKSLAKLQSIIDRNKPGSISVRKFNPQTDPITNVVNKVKMTEDMRIKHKTGKPYTLYISKDTINQFKQGNKEGGFLPLLPLLGLIAGGIGAAGSVAGGVAGAVLKKQENDAKEAHYREVEKAMRGEGYSNRPDCSCATKDCRCVDRSSFEKLPNMGRNIMIAAEGSGIKEFVDKLKIDPEDKKTLKRILKTLKLVAIVKKKGEGIYLSPKL